MKDYTLNRGDEIRVIAPSASLKEKLSPSNKRAIKRLEKLGYKVTFSKSCHKKDEFLSTAKTKDRAEDINEAIKDKNVKAILAAKGGWSSNDLLTLIDWQTLKENKKPIIGFSDITALLNASYQMTKTVNILGPTFSTIGKNADYKYTINSLNASLTSEEAITIQKSKNTYEYHEDPRKTPSYKVIRHGKAEGILLGGNIGTFFLLQGTKFQPDFNKPFIFAFEDDNESGKYTFYESIRKLESLLQLPGFKENLAGMIIGRYQKSTKISKNKVEKMINDKIEKDIPILYGLDFGHTLPLLSLPIGGKVRIDTSNYRKYLTINL